MNRSLTIALISFSIGVLITYGYTGHSKEEVKPVKSEQTLSNEQIEAIVSEAAKAERGNQ